MFDERFIQKHIIILEGKDEKAHISRLKKLAFEVFIQRYYRARAVGNNYNAPRISTSIFLTRNEFSQMKSHFENIRDRRSRMRRGSSEKFIYPENIGLQKISSIITVSDRKTNKRLYQAFFIDEGFNVGQWPIIEFEDKTGNGNIDHFSSITYTRAPGNSPFSLRHYRELNAQEPQDSEHMWINSLFD